MKRKIALLLATIVSSAEIASAADAAANWATNCASCHGKDGSGNPAMGKLGRKDFTKKQSFSDASATNTIKNGKEEMPGFGSTLSDADIKALVAYIRTLKK